MTQLPIILSASRLSGLFMKMHSNSVKECISEYMLVFGKMLMHNYRSNHTSSYHSEHSGSNDDSKVCISCQNSDSIEEKSKIWVNILKSVNGNLEILMLLLLSQT